MSEPTNPNKRDMNKVLKDLTKELSTEAAQVISLPEVAVAVISLDKVLFPEAANNPLRNLTSTAAMRHLYLFTEHYNITLQTFVKVVKRQLYPEVFPESKE